MPDEDHVAGSPEVRRYASAFPGRTPGKVMAEDLYALFARQLEREPDLPALIVPGGAVYSRREVAAEAARYARLLVELGLAPGDRVSVQVAKSPQALWLYLGCLRGGFVFHPLNDAYRSDEVRLLLHDAEPALAVCDPSREAWYRTAAPAGCQVLTLGSDGTGSLAERARRASGSAVVSPRAADDLAVLLYTSGTTGLPKGAMISHGNLASNVATLVSAWGFTAADRLLHALPVYHAHGLFVGVGCALASGATLLWLPRFEPAAVLRALPAASVMMGVPTYYTRLLAEPGWDRETMQHLRLFVSGSAPLSPETFAAFRERSGHAILERYGLTETGMNAANPLHGVRRPGSVGPALPGVAIRIRSVDGQVAPTGTIGEIELRGPNVFRGYWRQPVATAAAFTPDGWFRTGDQGSLAPDGYLTIVGRSKDLVISGGLNVYPREVELALETCAGVAEAAIVGAPHPDLGEGVVAVVVPAAGHALDTTAIMDSLRGRIAGFKLPKRLYVAPELPRNAMGKVEKAVLRERYARTFQAEPGAT
jgi:malonyl-CoA/methylmalonyl-CoA synthetase